MDSGEAADYILSIACSMQCSSLKITWSFRRLLPSGGRSSTHLRDDAKMDAASSLCSHSRCGRVECGCTLIVNLRLLRQNNLQQIGDRRLDTYVDMHKIPCIQSHAEKPQPEPLT